MTTQVKGSNLRLAQQYADAKREGAWRAILERLAADDRATINGVISSGWYPIGLQHRLFASLEHVLGSAEIESFARYAAERDLTQVHRLFLKVMNPAYVLEKSGEYWSRFYTEGTWNVTRISSTHARGELLGISESAAEFCRFLKSYMVRMFELAGAKAVTCRHTRCVLRGDGSCVFEGAWR